MQHTCTSSPLLDRLTNSRRENGSFLPVAPRMWLFPTNQCCFTPASCGSAPIHFCGLLFPQKPGGKSHHRDPERHLPGMARDAVPPDIVSVPRAKGSSEQWHLSQCSAHLLPQLGSGINAERQLCQATALPGWGQERRQSSWTVGI